MLFVVIAAAGYAYMFMSKLDLNGDNAVYIDLARNMALGRGYSTVDILGHTVPANHFPPGYPLLLCLLMRLGIYNLVAFKVVNGLFLLGSVAIVAYIIYNVSRQAYLAFAAAVITVLLPELNYFADIVMSEMSYTLFTMLALLALFRYSASDTARWYRSPWFWTAIVSAVAAYHIRTIGLSIIVTLILWLFIRREWRQGFTAIGSTALLMLPWIIRNNIVGVKSRYLDTMLVLNPWRPELGNVAGVGELAEKFITNLNETVVKGITQLVLPFMHVNFLDQATPWYLFPISFAVLALIFYGAWHAGRLRWAIILFILCNFGLFGLWHGGNGYRYVIPIVPLINACFYYGLFLLIVKAVKRPVAEHTPYAMVSLVMLLAMIGPIRTQREFAKTDYPLAYQYYFNMAVTLDAEAPAGTRVCCRKPELFKCFAPNTLTTNYKFTLNVHEFIMDLYDKQIDYVVFEQLGYESTYRYLLPVLQSFPELFEPVITYKDPDTVLFRFKRELIVFGPDEETSKNGD